MSSGEIKGMVMRVLPEVNLDAGKKPSEQTGSMVVSVILRAPVQSVVITNAVAPAELTPKQVMIKPVVTAFLLVSAVKTAGSQVVNVKLANNTTVIKTVISAASIQGTSNAIINAASATQQQTAVGAQATSELCQVLTTSQQQIKQAIIDVVASQPPKTVSRVLEVSSLQSSVVEAFNEKQLMMDHVMSMHGTLKIMEGPPNLDSRRTFVKQLMLEKHIQFMHGIKDPDVKEKTDATNEEEMEIEDAKLPSPKRKLEEPVLEFRLPRGAIT
ncbi:Zinc finger protein 532 [Camelus dromedarius]|uniref:Zinc finger protein 532 n=1 Tax=Camelus dromedarius TaxID=9838 RepID=A0A5N4DI86_CAMDR|nr:Zinc finger protein 532 [Camelus dromedarius]